VGGVTRFIYGGNAFLYHITLQEYDELIGWMAGSEAGNWMIPSLGHRTGGPWIRPPCSAATTFAVR
jgi:hypothetical protein